MLEKNILPGLTEASVEVVPALLLLSSPVVDVVKALNLDLSHSEHQICTH